MAGFGGKIAKALHQVTEIKEMVTDEEMIAKTYRMRVKELVKTLDHIIVASIVYLIGLTVSIAFFVVEIYLMLSSRRFLI